MIQYNADELRRIKYLLRRLSELKNGHTLSPQFTKGYPFYTYLNRFGEIELDKDSLNTDPIYQFLQQHSDIDKKVDLIELAWQYYLVYGTPNGCLFKNNSLFNTINNDSGLTLLHCTTRMNKIIDSGLLFPSGGCLGASLYCVPLRKDNRIHNLTSFMMEEEIPKTKGLKDSIAPGLLAIKIDSENFIHSNQESNGLDYLLMGEMQSSLYGQFKKNSDIDHQSFDSISKIIQESGILDAELYHFTFIQKAKEYRDMEKRYTTQIPHKCLHQTNYTYLWEAKAVASVIQKDLLEKEKRGNASDWFEIEIVNNMTLENYYWDITFDNIEFEKHCLQEDSKS